MSTPTTARGAVLRRAGTLFAAAALVAAPAATAFADPTLEPSAATSPSTTASATTSATAPVEPTTNPSPTASASPEATAPAPTVPGTGTPTPSGTKVSPTSPPSDAGTLRSVTTSNLLAAVGDPAPQTAYAAGFIARTLAAGGDHYVYPGGTYFDGGNTIDGIIALAASGTGRTQMGESLAYLDASLGSYTGADWGDLYVGGTAKSLIGVVAAGADPTAFGGTDLVADLKGLETASGRFSDTGSGDYTITITQALAVIALARAGEPLTAASVDTLIDQQCADGGFRSAIGDPDGCVSDPDVTAFAAQALIAAGANAEATEALEWLADAQVGDGSVASDDGTANANTTGVAAQAFAAGGYDAELADAQAFLVSLQYDCAAAAPLRGGLAFSATSRSTTTIADSDLRATPQGTLGLSGESLLSAVASEGATAGTTALLCTPTTTPTSTAPPASTGGSNPGAGGSAGSGGSDGSASGPTGSLAQTGSDLLLPVGLGLALVLVGGVTIAATRRRGAHA
jgi:hypothetical protein